MPDQNSKKSLANFVEERLETLRDRKTLDEIARQAAYRSPNMLAMVVAEETKVALDRVPDLARALECDPRELMRLALHQFFSESNVELILSIGAADAERSDDAGPRAATTPAILKDIQRDLREVRSTLPELLGVTNRQGNRLEREIADLRAELWRLREVVDPVDRTEPSDTFANFERRIDNHLDRHSEEMRAMLREELRSLGVGLHNRPREP
jgi:hypothetical protein